MSPESTEEPKIFERYVAIGDSSTEGLWDPDEKGTFHGWADRLAAHLAAANPEVLYANLAIRGKHTRQIHDEQLAPALAMQPDLVTFFSGTNDVIASRFDPDEVAADLDRVHRAVRATGATLLTFTLPDLTPVLPAARRVAPRIERLNEALRAIAATHGSRLVDLAQEPVAVDPRLWHDDRLHANAEGHARIASALAHALALPGIDGTWRDPLPVRPPSSRVARAGAEALWISRHLVPWLLRHLRGRSSGDTVTAKRPQLTLARELRIAASSVERRVR